MPFKIENIDRAIEWALRDQAIEKGYWPDERAFITSGDEVAYNAAIDNIDKNSRVDIFGTGNYKDREKLSQNNITINRIAIMEGDQVYNNPYIFELQTDKTFNKIFVGDGTNHIIYEIRFICDDVVMDRILNMVLIEAIGRRKDLPGINDDLTNMEETFLITKEGTPIDLSNSKAIERVFRYKVHDVNINEQKVVQTGIQMIKEMTLIQNIDQDNPPDVQFPKDRNDVNENVIGPNDYFIGLLQGLDAWNKFHTVRLYANSTQSNALKNLKWLGAPPAVNSGLTFSPFNGFSKTGLGQYLNTKIKPSDDQFNLTSFSYSVFISEIPTAGIMELFGLDDGNNSLGFHLLSDPDDGFEANANSGIFLQSSDFKVKAGKLYTLNSRDRFQTELWEADKLIGILEQEPEGKPVGSIAELNIFDETGASIGTSTGGGISFSACGSGMTASEIRELNRIISFFMTKIGVTS